VKTIPAAGIKQQFSNAELRSQWKCGRGTQKIFSEKDIQVAHTIWKGTISFGLIAVPVKVSTGARSSSIGFNLLHSCGEKISQVRRCSHCATDIAWNDAEKGYWDDASESYLRVSPDDLKKCLPESSREITISSVVSASEIGPELLETGYFMAPAEGGNKGYALLVAALHKVKGYALATITLTQREHLIAIRPVGDALTFHTLYYADEMREAPEVPAADISAKEVDLAVQLLSLSKKKFRHAEYKDRYAERVEKMLAAKTAKKPLKLAVLKPVVKPGAAFIDALEKSLKLARKKVA
jgi:DNA end-binding protein Ku